MKNFNEIPFLDLEPKPICNIHAKSIGATLGATFYNLTNTTVFVVNRQGVVIKTDPSYVSGLGDISGNFIIRSSIDIDKEKNVSFPTDSSEEDVMKLFYNSLSNSVENYPYGKKSIYYDSHLSLKELKEHGTVYLRKFDILVSLTPDVLHPYSESFSRYKDMDRKRRVTDTETTIKIVDNKGILGTQYVMVYGQVQSVTPVKDMSRGEGVYITRTFSKPRRNSKFNTETVWSKLENHRITNAKPREPLIFDTYDEAANHTDLSGREKREYERTLADLRKMEVSFKEKELHYKERERKLEMENREKELRYSEKEKQRDLEAKEREMRFRESERKQEAEIKRKEMEAKERELEMRRKILELDRLRKQDEERVDALKREYQRDTLMEKQKISEMEIRLKKEQQRLSELDMKHKQDLMKIKEGYERRSATRKDVSETIRMTPVVIAGVVGILGYVYGRNSS